MYAHHYTSLLRMFCLKDQVILMASIFASLVTIVGNITVLLSFPLNRGSGVSITYYCIYHLAITDMCVGFISMPVYTFSLIQEVWPFGAFLCKVWLSADYSISLVSQCLVFLITLDRFCMVRIPIQHRLWKDPIRIKTMIFLAWIIPFSFFTFLVFCWTLMFGSDPAQENTCFVGWANNGIFNAMLITTYFWIPLTLMLYMYANIYRISYFLPKKWNKNIKSLLHLNEVKENMKEQKMKRHSILAHTNYISIKAPLGKVDHGENDSLQSLEHSMNKCRRNSLAAFAVLTKQKSVRKLREMKRNRPLKRITLIMGAYILCWSPYHLLETYRSFSPASMIDARIYALSYWLCYMNSTINPFLYAVANKDIKLAMLKVISFEWVI